MTHFENLQLVANKLARPTSRGPPQKVKIERNPFRYENAQIAGWDGAWLAGWKDAQKEYSE